MSKNRSKKSVRLQNYRSHKVTVNNRRPVTAKGFDQSVKAQSSRGETARPAKQSASKRVKVATQAMVQVGKTSIFGEAIAVKTQVQELERGSHLKQLHERGLSLAELARKFGCSKSLVRDLVELASLPKELEQAYIQGQIGRKAVLKRARAEKKQVAPKKPALAPEPQNDAYQNFVLVLTEEDREKKVTENAQLIINWFHSLNLASCYWEGFFQQVKFGLYGPFRWLFNSEAPQPDEIKPDENPWDVIKRCKVEKGNPRFVTDIVNDLVTWLARWVQRVVSDRAIMEDAIDQARRTLLRETRTARWL